MELILEAPVLGHYAGDDGFFSPEMARDLEAKLRGLGKSATLYVYDGVDHAFFNDTRPEVHDEDAATQAWNRTLSFFRSKLG